MHLYHFHGDFFCHCKPVKVSKKPDLEQTQTETLNIYRFFELQPNTYRNCDGSLTFYLTTSTLGSSRIYIMWGSYYDQLFLQGALPFVLLLFCYIRLSNHMIIQCSLNIIFISRISRIMSESSVRGGSVGSKRISTRNENKDGFEMIPLSSSRSQYQPSSV